MSENNNNGKYLSWGFVKKMGIVLGGLATLSALLISVYCWLDAKIETKMDRALFLELMNLQTASFKETMAEQNSAFRETMATQSASLNKLAASQDEMARQLHAVDVRLVKIETKLEK